MVKRGCLSKNNAHTGDVSQGQAAVCLGILRTDKLNQVENGGIALLLESILTPNKRAFPLEVQCRPTGRSVFSGSPLAVCNASHGFLRLGTLGPETFPSSKLVPPAT